MSQPQQNPPKQRAFEITEVNTRSGWTYLRVNKGIIGSLSNQLKTTGNEKNCAIILRKLGSLLSDAGNVQYGRPVETTRLDPAIVFDTEIDSEE